MKLDQAQQNNEKDAAMRPYTGGLSKEELSKESQAPELFKLSSNENPLGPSPAVIEAIQKNAATLGEYPPTVDDRLRETLVGLHGRNLSPDHFVVGNSGCDILDLIGRAYLNGEVECIICPPTFPVYQLTAQQQGAMIIEVPLEPRRFGYQLDQILAAVTEKTGVVYLCSPNNPTGSLLNHTDLARLVDQLPDQVLIVFDEVYYHFVTAPERPDPLEYVLAGKNFIILHSFSKAYGLAGLRLGYGIAKPEIAARLAHSKRPFHLNRFAFEAGIAAINDQHHIKKSVDLTLQGRQWLYQQLQDLGLKVWPSQGNFLLFQCPGPAKDYAAKLLKYGVMVRPAFGLPNHLRVTVGLPEANEAFIEGVKQSFAGSG